MVVRLDSGTGDDGADDERRQAVLAEAFRMVGADRQRGTLRIPNAAFLINNFRPKLPHWKAPQSARFEANMSEVILSCLATGRAFNSGFEATRDDLRLIPPKSKIRIRCGICGETHEFDFAAARICECPNFCRERKDCQRCEFAR